MNGDGMASLDETSGRLTLNTRAYMLSTYELFVDH